MRGREHLRMQRYASKTQGLCGRSQTSLVVQVVTVEHSSHSDPTGLIIACVIALHVMSMRGKGIPEPPFNFTASSLCPKPEDSYLNSLDKYWHTNNRSIISYSIKKIDL